MMQAIGQNIAIGAALLFLVSVMLRQIPILGFFVRLVTRLLLLVSPLAIIVLVVGLAWFHGSAWFSSGGSMPPPNVVPVVATERAVSPTMAPMPPERPR